LDFYLSESISQQTILTNEICMLLGDGENTLDGEDSQGGGGLSEDTSPTVSAERVLRVWDS